MSRSECPVCKEHGTWGTTKLNVQAWKNAHQIAKIYPYIEDGRVVCPGKKSA